MKQTKTGVRLLLRSAAIHRRALQYTRATNVTLACSRALATIVIASLLCSSGGCSRNTGNTPKILAGSGSTFVYPLMVQWASAYEKKEEGCKILYRSLGSGGGIHQITERKVDFACTDAPMTDAELATAREKGGEIVHIPLVLGAVVAAYNLPDLKEPLRFTGPVLADIFLGKITKWNDESLKKINPGVQLPDQPIAVVHRRDGSGTTYIWTDFLSKSSTDWLAKVGRDHEVKWPTGNAEVGNDGIADFIKTNGFSLGYVELSQAHRKDIAFGLIQNREGEFVKASLHATTTAASNALGIIPDDLRYSLTDPPGKGSYPICGTTWAIVYQDQLAKPKSEVSKFLHWVIDEGQVFSEGLFYSRLPEALAARAKQKLDKMQAAN